MRVLEVLTYTIDLLEGDDKCNIAPRLYNSDIIDFWRALLSRYVARCFFALALLEGKKETKESAQQARHGVCVWLWSLPNSYIKV